MGVEVMVSVGGCMLSDEIKILLAVNASDAVIIAFWGFMAGQIGEIAQ